MTATTRAPGVRGRAALAGVLAVAGAVATAYVALSTAGGQSVDQRAFSSVVIDRGGRTEVLSVLGQVSIGAILVLMVACVAVALVRGSWRAAIAAVVVIAGSNVTTQVLKHAVLERADLGTYLGENSLPSGHTTVVASGVGALFLVSPRRLRPFLALLAAGAVTFVGSSTVVAGWHRPSDILAAFGVCLAWTAAGAIFVGGERRRSAASILPAVGGAGVAAVALLVFGVRPAYGWAGIVDAVAVHGFLVASAVLLVVVLEWITPSSPRGVDRSEPSPVGVAGTAGAADRPPALHP